MFLAAIYIFRQNMCFASFVSFAIVLADQSEWYLVESKTKFHGITVGNQLRWWLSCQNASIRMVPV